MPWGSASSPACKAMTQILLASLGRSDLCICSVIWFRCDVLTVIQRLRESSSSTCSYSEAGPFAYTRVAMNVQASIPGPAGNVSFTLSKGNQDNCSLMLQPSSPVFQSASLQLVEVNNSLLKALL